MMTPEERVKARSEFKASLANMTKEELEALAAKAEGRIHILAGAGVSDAVIKPLYEKGIRHFHLSAKIELESAMKYRNTRVIMGLPGMIEYMIWQTDDKKVRSARMVLDACSGKEV